MVNLPESVDITTPVGNILWPKENGHNEIIYCCHGSYEEEEDPFVDEDGEVFDPVEVKEYYLTKEQYSSSAS